MPSGYKKNYKNHAVIIPRFTISEVTGITFGGFVVDKYPCSQPSAVNEAGTAWYDVAHSGAAGVVPGISKPGVPVWDYITFPQAMIACANKGKGWHLLTDYEWASLAFLAKKLGTQPHGGNANTNPPSDIDNATETARLDEHLTAENPSYHRALPGTGPNQWAHNHVASGVFDLQGLAWQWICMMMTTAGYPLISANKRLSYQEGPAGRGTVSETDTLTCDGSGINWMKGWRSWLKYDAEDGSITEGLHLTGITSGATREIASVIDLGTDGILELKPINTTVFQDNEILAFSTSGLSSKNITGAADNGSGAIRITSASHGYSTGNKLVIESVGGTTEANNDDSNPAWVITVIDANTYDLDGSTFTNAYTSGGTSKIVTAAAAANGTETGEFATKNLNYDGQTSNFSLGDTVTGATTGHSARVVVDEDSGDYGVLTLIDATGVFQDNEELQVSAVTKALANGTAISCYAYIAEAAAGAGTAYEITASAAQTLTLSGSPANGTATFWIYRQINIDITDGMSSSNKILTLRNSDAALKHLALPATSDGTGSSDYGNDAYYFSKSALRATLRGGSFSREADAGVFAESLLYVPSTSYYNFDFRAAKAM